MNIIISCFIAAFSALLMHIGIVSQNSFAGALSLAFACVSGAIAAYGK